MTRQEKLPVFIDFILQVNDKAIDLAAGYVQKHK